MKTTVTFIKSYTPYVKGDIARIEEEEAIDFEKKGFVVIGVADMEEFHTPDIEPELISDKNIKGETYKKGKIDVVIPTTNAKETKKKSKKTK